MRALSVKISQGWILVKVLFERFRLMLFKVNILFIVLFITVLLVMIILSLCDSSIVLTLISLINSVQVMF